jgi:hypothetical protein
MASRKKAEKVEEPIEVNPEEEPSSEGGFGASLGGMGGTMSKETQMHLFKALSELAIAADGMIPKSKMPEEAKKHAMAAKKEILLTVRALIDARIECMDKGMSVEGPKLKKIKVE